MRSFFEELKQRQVYRVALAYVVVGSAAVQLIGTVASMFHARDWIQQVFVVLIALGFPVALVLGWVFEVDRGGLRKTVISRANASSNKRRLWALGLTGLLVAIIALAGYWKWHPWRIAAPVLASDTIPIPEKSIAVLPFENLSDDKQNGYFTDGVQEEILNDLAKVADLKVISRTSVLQFRTGTERNLRDIARALGVAHIVEGSVQRVGDRVRVNAQLIDARIDKHLWAQHYDRQLTDVFTIQSELAEQIVSQLQAKLSPDEKAAIEEPPTADLGAYDLYARAKSIASAITYNARGKQILFEAVDLLDQAVARDPNFLLAYCQLARRHDQIYFLGLDHTPSRLALATKAVETALRLRPDAGAAHLARAFHLYCGFLDYDGARAELALAQKALPNESYIFELTGYVDRRQGRFESSIKAMKRALELDPRNLFLLQQIATTYESLRQFDEMRAVLDRALAVAPDDTDTRIARAMIDLQARADPAPVHATIDAVLREDPEAAGDLAKVWFYVAQCKRDYTALGRALAAMTPGGCREQSLAFPDSWCEGVAARLRGDTSAAQSAFTNARAEVAKIVSDQPDYAEALCVLGLIDATLGRKEDAIREGKRAVELLPVSKDSINGELLLEYLALIYAWSDQKDLAVKELTIASRLPAQMTYGDLRLHPFWDPLRGDPGFEQLVASLAPGAEAAGNGH